MNKELEELEELNYNLDLTKTTTYINHYYDIKNALTEKQDLERFTRLVVEKRVAMDLITNEETKDYIKYNSHCDKYDFIVPLNEEEFTFIKEMIAKYGKRI